MGYGRIKTGARHASIGARPDVTVQSSGRQAEQANLPALGGRPHLFTRGKVKGQVGPPAPAGIKLLTHEKLNSRRCSTSPTCHTIQA